MTKYVYLGGFIEGLTWKEAFEWREKAEIFLKDIDIPCYNPGINVPESFKTSNKIITFDSIVEDIGPNGEVYPGSIKDQIFNQTLFHLKQSNICLFNLKHFKTTPCHSNSIGTFWELGVGFILSKFIIAFDIYPQLESDPFIKNSIDLSFSSLDESLDYIARL